MFAAFVTERVPNSYDGTFMVDSTVVVEFKNEEEMREWVKARETGNMYDRRSYRLFNCTPLEVKLSIEISTK